MKTLNAQTNNALVMPKGSGTHCDMGDQRGTFIISYRSTSDAFAMGVLDVDFQGGVPPHYHTREDELFYILEGRFTAQVGDQKIEAGPGDTLFAPRNIIHTWACVSEEGGRVLAVLTPGSNFETFFLEMSDRQLIPTQIPNNPSIAVELDALARRHGIQMLPQSCDLPHVYEPAYVPAGDGIYVNLGDHEGWGKIGSEQTGNAFLFSETRAQKNGGVPPHIHHREDELFYILEGRFVFQVGDRTVEVGPGDTVYGPRAVKHAWQCLSDEGGRLLILFTPGANFEAFAMEMAELSASPARDMEDPAAAAAFIALTERYGIEMLNDIK